MLIDWTDSESGSLTASIRRRQMNTIRGDLELEGELRIALG